MLQAALDQLTRRGIHHCDLLKPRVKIASYNQLCRPAPFLRTLVESPSPSLLARREPTTLSNQKVVSRDEPIGSLADSPPKFLMRLIQILRLQFCEHAPKLHSEVE